MLDVKKYLFAASHHIFITQNDNTDYDRKKKLHHLAFSEKHFSL